MVWTRKDGMIILGRDLFHQYFQGTIRLEWSLTSMVFIVWLTGDSPGMGKIVSFPKVYHKGICSCWSYLSGSLKGNYPSIVEDLSFMKLPSGCTFVFCVSNIFKRCLTANNDPRACSYGWSKSFCVLQCFLTGKMLVWLKSCTACRRFLHPSFRPSGWKKHLFIGVQLTHEPHKVRWISIEFPLDDWFPNDFCWIFCCKLEDKPFLFNFVFGEASC